MPLALAAQEAPLTPARARALLNSVTFEERFHRPDPIPAPRVLTGAERIALTLQDTPLDGRILLVARQGDVRWRRPVAAVGDTLIAFRADTADAFPMVVRARRAFEQADSTDMCGAPEFTGWSYLLEGDTAIVGRALASSQGRYNVYLVRAPFTPVSFTFAPATTRSRITPLLRAWREGLVADALRELRARPGTRRAQQVRRDLVGSRLAEALAYVTAVAVRGPAGRRLWFTTFSAASDPDESRFGQTVWRRGLSLLVDDAGARVASFPLDAGEVIAIADLDGDGVDEVATSAGTFRFDGARWIAPLPAPPRLILTC